jgi:hypothetical protein
MTASFLEPVLAGAAPKGLGRAIQGGAGAVARRGNDFYPTPSAVTRALIAVERPRLLLALCPGEPVWEPCGRGGAITRELRDAGFATTATDIVADPGNEVVELNLLLAASPLSRVVVTNPPFALAAEMIRHLLGDLRCSYGALLLKATFWHAATRSGLWQRHTPARIHALNWRPDFLGGGAPTMDVIWTVWDGPVAVGETRYSVLGPARVEGLL